MKKSILFFLITLVSSLSPITNVFGQTGETNDVVTYIKKESIGGKLDFNKALEKKEQSLFLIGDVAYNKKDAAIYLWGKKVKLLGVSSPEKAIKLWEEINSRKLTDPEGKALLNGYSSKTE